MEGDQEEEVWESVREGMEMVSALILTNKAQGPFVLGGKPSLTDFFVAGRLQAARVVDEGTFERMVGFEGYRRVYEGCLEWMGRED